MIPLKLQIILVVASVVSFVFIINTIRKYNLELRYSLLWMLFCVVNVIFAVFSKIPYLIATTLGIQQPVNAIFLLSAIFQFFLIFSLTLTISRLSGHVSKLVQEVGMLKREVEEQQKALTKIKGVNE